MKYLVCLSILSHSVVQGECYWEAYESGTYIQCQDDFYLAGACECRSSRKCTVNGVKNRGLVHVHVDIALI